MTALILMYHRVARVALDPWGLCVSPEHFAEQLEVLRRSTNPMRLRDLVAALRADAGPPPRTVVVTFDDGYADNLELAKPLLERSAIPATVFITTGPVRTGEPFWWDELERAILQPDRLPERLRLDVEGTEFAWQAGAAPRDELYQSLWRRLQPIPAAARRVVLGGLISWSQAGPQEESRRPLMPEELLRLAGGELIEIGAHTVTHPVLAALSLEAQRAEVRESKAELEGLLGRAVRSFSYPYGAAENFSSETVAAVRAAGYESACSTRAASVAPGCDPFRLPRVQVGDWDGAEFERRLADWLAD